MMKRSILLGLAAGILLSTMAFAGPVEQKAAAVAAGEAWLKTIDKGDYAGGFKESSELVKIMTEDQWVTSVKTVRDGFGEVLTRVIGETTAATTLPGAPDGDYVVIHFNTSFANKVSAVETLTLQLAPDGQWRAAGYFIR